MADVTDDRGQLILVTGLLIAVAMVSLVLLLNTAIYTENLASRGADQSSREAVEYQASVVDGVGGLVEEENRREHPSQTAAEDNVTEGIERIDNYTARSHGIGGTAVRINETTVVLTEGRLLRQTDSTREFADESDGTSLWTLATDVQNTRDYRMTVDRTSLVTTNATDALTEGAFTVRAGGTSWRAVVYRNWSTGDVAVAVEEGGSMEQTCSWDADAVTIDMTRGAINDTDCSGLVFADGVSPGYSIEYEDGDNVTGTYNLTVEHDPSSSTFPGMNDGRTNPSSPYWVPAVYSSEFNISYESPSLTYRSTVRVAPGESP